MSSPGPSLTPPPAVSSPSSEQTALPALGLSKGDVARWFTDEVHAHDGQLKSWLRGQFPAVRDVEDVVQESYLRVWKARLRQPITQTKSFLFQVARHIALDLLRRGKRSRTDSLGDLAGLDVPTDEASPLEALSQSEKISLVVAALLELPDRCRQVFVLRKFEGIPQREVAARLGITESTVENQLARGMKLFEAQVRKRGLDGYLRDEK